MYAALLFATVVAASPILERGSQTFTVDQIAKPVVKSGPIALAKAYQKYGSALPTELKAAAAAAASGSVTAAPEQYDEEYLSPVTVGGQTLNLQLDTGSSDLWVFSSELPSSESAGHSVYTLSASTNSKLLNGYSWSITFGDGSMAGGNVYDDTVSVGGVTVTSQAVEAAQSVSATFVQDTMDSGILGLAFSGANTVQPVQQSTFFDNAKASLASPLFTADLKSGAPGSFDFGFINASKHTGSITYVPVNSANFFWEFTSSGYAVGSGSFVSGSIDAIADTGTSNLLLPTEIVLAYYEQVEDAEYDYEQGAIVFPCSATLPDITLGIGSYHATVPGSYINYAPVDASGTVCFGGIQPTPEGTPADAVYGDTFLKSQFVVFDDAASGPQLGVAAKNL